MAGAAGCWGRSECDSPLTGFRDVYPVEATWLNSFILEFLGVPVEEIDSRVLGPPDSEYLPLRFDGAVQVRFEEPLCGNIGIYMAPEGPAVNAEVRLIEYLYFSPDFVMPSLPVRFMTFLTDRDGVYRFNMDNHREVQRYLNEGHVFHGIEVRNMGPVDENVPLEEAVLKVNFFVD